MYLFSDPVVAGQTSANPVMAAIQSASRETGTDFSYLLATAKRESSLNPDAKAPTSSAAGLFQFIEQTWLRTVRDSGAEHGLEDLAAEIQTNSRGHAYVGDAETRSDVLALRYDPEIAALMAGELTEENRAGLERALGRTPKAGELYIAHFLGLDGASRFIQMAETDPSASAASHFPQAARANTSIFYQGGTARSVSQVYANLIAKHDAVEQSVTPPQPAPANTKGLFRGFAEALFGLGRTAGIEDQRSTPVNAVSFAESPRHGDPAFQELFSGPRATQRLGPIGARSANMFNALYADAMAATEETFGPSAARSLDPTSPAGLRHTGGQEATPPVQADFSPTDERPSFWSPEPLQNRNER